MAHYGVLCLDQGSLSVRASLVAGWDQLAEEMKSNAQPFVSPDHRAAAAGFCRSDALACADIPLDGGGRAGRAGAGGLDRGRGVRRDAECPAGDLARRGSGVGGSGGDLVRRPSAPPTAMCLTPGGPGSTRRDRPSHRCRSRTGSRCASPLEPARPRTVRLHASTRPAAGAGDRAAGQHHAREGAVHAGAVRGAGRVVRAAREPGVRGAHRLCREHGRGRRPRPRNHRYARRRPLELAQRA